MLMLPCYVVISSPTIPTHIVAAFCDIPRARNYVASRLEDHYRRKPMFAIVITHRTPRNPNGWMIYDRYGDLARPLTDRTILDAVKHVERVEASKYGKRKIA